MVGREGREAEEALEDVGGAQIRLLTTAVADEVDEPSRRSRCAENRKSVLIKTCKISARLSTRSGCRQSPSCRSLLVREKHRRS
jgi:hypothetical protein